MAVFFDNKQLVKYILQYTYRKSFGYETNYVFYVLRKSSVVSLDEVTATEFMNNYYQYIKILLILTLVLTV